MSDLTHPHSTDVWSLRDHPEAVASVQSEFAGTRRSLTQIREEVESFIADAPLDDLAVLAFQMAVDEICANVVEHGYEKSSPTGDLTLLVDLGRFVDRIEAIVTDTSAIPFEIDGPGGSSEGLLHHQQERGLGLDIVRHCVDKVEHQWLPPQGNQTRLTKFYP